MENETPIGEVIKKKKDKKKAKKERLLAELERKRNLEEGQVDGQPKKIKYDNVFEAQKAKTNLQGLSSAFVSSTVLLHRSFYWNFSYFVREISKILRPLNFLNLELLMTNIAMKAKNSL